MVNIKYHRKFYKSLKKIPSFVVENLSKKEILFKKNPFDNKLKTHKLNGTFKDKWSFSVNHYYRVIFKFEKKDLVEFIDIGTHEIYK